MNRDDRLSAAARSLDGLSVGDAFGECFFSIQLNPQSWDLHLSTRTLPNWGWRWTDDTAMAVSIVEMLSRRGTIEQDELADAFARRYAWDDRRGYGGTAHGILMAIREGAHWSHVAPAVMSGSGSMGNGSAMRVAPLGAFFADDPTEVVLQAVRSAEVTHAHPEGHAGAVAVALAAAFALKNPDATVTEAGARSLNSCWLTHPTAKRGRSSCRHANCRQVTQSKPPSPCSAMARASSRLTPFPTASGLPPARSTTLRTPCGPPSPVAAIWTPPAQSLVGYSRPHHVARPRGIGWRDVRRCLLHCRDDPRWLDKA